MDRADPVVHWPPIGPRLVMSNAAYAEGLKHGPARGGQAVHFVQQVRTYMHILDGGAGA